jgi:hypothetical protein
MPGSPTTDTRPQTPQSSSHAGIVNALARVDAWSPQGCAGIVQPLTPPSTMEKHMNTHPTQTIRRWMPCGRILGTTGWVAACAGLLVWGTTSAYALPGANGLTINGINLNGPVGAVQQKPTVLNNSFSNNALYGYICESKLNVRASGSSLRGHSEPQTA